MQDPVLTHHIQLYVLKKMLSKPSLRYSELKPKDVEANLFMYHLKQLIKAGLIVRGDQAYSLSRLGKQFADRATLSNMKIRIQPKVITIVTVRRADGAWLLLRRKHQPFLDYKGFPSGKIHFGEKLLQAATRELYEKSGLVDVELQLRGNLIMHFRDGQEPVSHINGYVFYGEVPRGCDVTVEQEHFDCYFANESALHEKPAFKGHELILELLKQHDALFIEEYESTTDF